MALSCCASNYQLAGVLLQKAFDTSAGPSVGHLHERGSNRGYLRAHYSVTHMNTRQCGAYFLANDNMLDFAIAFLNSFRTYNPTLALCMIPFNDNCGRLCTLQDKYTFSIWNNQEALLRCDAISLCFHDRVTGQYRKLVIWDGPFDEFVYIDVDTVILGDVTVGGQFLDQFGFVTSHSHLPHIRRWVWRDSIYESRALTAEQIEYATNTGFVTSKKGALNWGSIEGALTKAIALARHMELLCTEQPLLNYLMVTSGHAYTSLLRLRTQGHSYLPREAWGGVPLELDSEGRLQPSDPSVLLVHWAGEWRKLSHGTMPNDQLWRRYRFMDM